MTPEATPLPIPIPVTTGFPLADWVMIGVTFLGIIVSGSIALLAYFATKRAAQAQLAAINAQVEAANANERALNAQVGLLEDAVREDEARADQTLRPTPSGVRWVVEPTSSHGRYLLRNVGGIAASRVHVEGLTVQDRTDFMPGSVDYERIEPSQATLLRVERSFASPPATVVVVEWVEEGHNRRERLVLS